MTRKRGASKSSSDRTEWLVTQNLFLGSSVVASVRYSIEQWHGPNPPTLGWAARYRRFRKAGPLHPLAVY